MVTSQERERSGQCQHGDLLSTRQLAGCLVLLGCAGSGLITAGIVRADAPEPAQFSIAGPGSLVLGKDTQTTLSIHAPAAARFHVYTNTGQLGAATPIAAGEWRLDYTLPTQKYPQVALIALVTEDGVHFAWTTIALHGSARVEIQSEPEVLVEVRVGQALFGPTTTDGAGRAELPVVVPPGYTSVTSIATDGLGNQKEQTIPLGVPAFQRLLSVCAAQQRLGFWVFTVDQQGLPQANALIDVSGPPARVTGVTPVSPGVYRVAFEVPDPAQAGKSIRVSASLRGDPTSSHACESTIPVAPHESDRDNGRAPLPNRHATHDRTRFLVGLLAGYVTNFAKIQAPQIALRAGLRLPLAEQRLSLELLGSYHYSHHAGPSSDGAETIDTTVSALPLLVRVAYTFELRPFDVWLFGAGGLLFAGTEVAGEMLGRMRASTMTVAYAAGSGVGLVLGPGHIGLELSYMHAQIATRALTGNVAGFSANLGYVLDL
jgi:hypothetical protein